MTKLEEVARAIRSEIGAGCINAGEIHAAARAAIEAMRTPTPEMLAAGSETEGECLDWSLEPGEGLDGFNPQPAWEAMVDAALKDA